MKERRKLVLVADRDVTLPWSGGSIRDRGLCEGLTDRLEVTYVILSRDVQRSKGELVPGFQWVRLPLSRLHKAVHTLLTAGGLDLCLTYEPLLYLSPSSLYALRSLLRDASFFGTVYPYLFPICRRLDRRKPLIYWSHNCEGELADIWTCGARPGLGGVIKRLIIRNERKAFQESRMVIACSQGDLDAMENRYGETVSEKVVIPNGVDTKNVFPAGAREKAQARSSLSIDKPLAIFVASASWEPNGQAARFILHHLAPNVPEVLFCLAGTIGLDLAGERPPSTFSPSPFLEGWYPPEHWKGEGLTRWMGAKARLQLPDHGGGRLLFLAAAPSSLNAARLRRFLPFLPWRTRDLEVSFQGKLLGRYEVEQGFFTPVEVEVPEGVGEVSLQALEVNEPTAKEPRGLGMAMSQFSWAPSCGDQIIFEMEGLHNIPGAPDNVLITGWVSDEFKRRLLHSSDVGINPMLSGSGSNLKMLEAMAAGLPIVTTPFGARGIDVRDGLEAMIVEPERMADAIRSLVHSEERMKELGRCAAAKAESAYSWKILSQDLGKRLCSIEQCIDGEAV